MAFQISALPRTRFEPLFNLTDAELARHGALRRVATSKPGFPCRVSLADAEPGEAVLLLHYEHQDAASPFRASHAIYVRPKAAQADPGIDELPNMLRTRTLSLRGFDAAGMMVDTDLVNGGDIEALVDRLLAVPSIAYIHVHFAKPGCYAARIDRR